jgi:hypothetical protein
VRAGKTDVDGNGLYSCVSTLPIIGQVRGQTVSATNIITGDSSELSRYKTVTTGR